MIQDIEYCIRMIGDKKLFDMQDAVQQQIKRKLLR